MDFDVLGPLEVRRDGRPVELGGRKTRALLAVLLLHANEVVATDRLVDELWGERPTETAPAALQVYVAQLRKLLGRERIATRPPGYRLVVHHGELDLHRFQALAAAAEAAQPTEAAALLREALALWRGEPLADLADEPFARAEAARLEELRLAALERRIDADLALARHGDVVPELERLVADHPLRERFRAQLMLALYRSGRQADALAAYQAARAALVDELGLDPGPELQGLERRILRHDASLALPQTAPGPAPQRADNGRRPAGPFVGRERELAALDAALDDAVAGHGRVLLLAGEPGIGKSRLAEELADHATVRGATVLWGRCWEAGGAPAYWPWTQALRAYLARPEAELGRLGRDHAAELGQLVPELLGNGGHLERPALDPDSARFRLFEAAAHFLRAAAGGAPLVLLLDDLHAADEPSLLLLRFLTRELAAARVLVVGAYRDVDPTLSAPLSTTIADIVRAPVTRRIHVAGLSETDVDALIRETTRVAPGEGLAAAIHDETAGNPLFVGEVVRLLAAEGRLTARPSELDVAGVLPDSVREVIGRRTGRLSARCREVLRAASVLGREFDLDALELLADTPGDELLDVLDEGRRERVVSDVPGSPGRLRFAHALIRDVLYDEVSSSGRARLHARAGEALVRLYGAGAEAHLAELAHHFVRAGRSERERAVDYARRAGDQAVELLAFEEGARLYALALEALARERPVDETLRCALLLRLGEAQVRGGDGPSARSTFLAASEVAQREGLADALAQAALGYGGRFPWSRARADRRLVQLLERALDGLPADAGAVRVKVLGRLAGALRDELDPRRRVRLSDEAIALARDLDDPAALAYALAAKQGAAWWPDRPGETLATATELVDVARDAADVERMLDGHMFRFFAFLESRDRRAVYAELEATERLAAELRQPAQQWVVATMRAELALLEGRFAEAEKLIAEARRLERAQSSDEAAFYAVQMFTLRRETGRLGEVEELIGAFAGDRTLYPGFACMAAALALELGRDDDARRALEDLAAEDFADHRMDNEGVHGLVLLAEVVRALGDRERAARLYALLEPYRSVDIAPGEVSIGAATRPLGILAAVTERWDLAVGHFESALAENAAMHARPWVARTQYDYADMLLARDRDQDRARAAEMLAAAQATCDELGMVGLRRSVAALAERARG